MTAREERLVFKRIGYQIRAQRESVGFSQDTVAGGVGLTRTSIVNIEAGRQKLPISMLIKISNLLGRRASDILRNSE